MRENEKRKGLMEDGWGVLRLMMMMIQADRLDSNAQRKKKIFKKKKN